MVANPLVFVASPLRADTPDGVMANTNRARAYSRWVMEQGFIPFAPHLLFTQFMEDQVDSERERALAMTGKLVEICGQFWAFGDTLSSGMMREASIARALNKPVRWYRELGAPDTGLELMAAVPALIPVEHVSGPFPLTPREAMVLPGPIMADPPKEWERFKQIDWTRQPDPGILIVGAASKPHEPECGTNGVACRACGVPEHRFGEVPCQ